MSEYTPTIGLEIHAELKTRTKMFCNSRNDSNETNPNVNICPVCMAHPGTLPVINREAVKHVLQVGAAINGKLADYTEFDRKNYFYPDLPKGYQISQYEYPLVSGGELCGVQLTRIHLEEDTASSVHDDKTGETLVDYNRAGVPLMELVTEPVITSAEEAGKFARELQLLLRCLRASDANMEKGEMRVEANVSVGKDGKIGTKVEIKNLNSFRAMERAVAYEIKRQTEVLEKGELVQQETRGWDEGKQQTFSQRIKEVSADYRYFPDPDLPKLRISEISEFTINSLTSEMPELPWQRRQRYLDMGISQDDADMYVRDSVLGGFFSDVINELGEHADKTTIKLVSNYIATDLTTLVRDIGERDTEKQGEISISPAYFAKLITLVSSGKISSRGAKDILADMVGGASDDPEAIAERKGLFQVSSDEEILPIIEQVINENATVVSDYKSGKESALQFLVGQGMKLSKGSANPQSLKKLFSAKIQNR